MKAYNFPKVILKSGKERSLQRFHPWVFSGAIKNIIGNAKEGDNVLVLNAKQEFLGIGHYQEKGSISVRVFAFNENEIDYNFWKNKFANAINLRKNLGLIDNQETNVFRLIHGEGDGFPGFICDYYNGLVVFQSHSYGMYQMEEEFAKILKELLGDKLVAVYDKSDKTLPQIDGKVIENHFIIGELEETIVKEYNMKFAVNVVKGQKTGFFIDQRENRHLVMKYSKGKNVLNMFCYTGGFSIAALMGGAKSCTSVDASATAIELVKNNHKLNFDTDNHEALAVDAFDYLENMPKGKFDLVILDPPAFAKHINATPQAIKGYTRLNRQAMEKMENGTFLFTFSCSQAIKKDVFRMCVMEASIQAKKKIRILDQLAQPECHPISMYHPEGEYLKGLLIYVEDDL